LEKGEVVNFELLLFLLEKLVVNVTLILLVRILVVFLLVV